MPMDFNSHIFSCNYLSFSFLTITLIEAIVISYLLIDLNECKTNQISSY